MKRLVLMFMIACIGISANAQSKDTTSVNVKQKTASNQQNPAAYACPKCFEITKGAGTCAKCNMEKVQLGTYYCFKCSKGTGAKPGACPVCKGETVQITRKYCAAHGGTPLKEHNKEGADKSKEKVSTHP